MQKVIFPYWTIFILLLILVESCTPKNETTDLPPVSRLDTYLSEFNHLERDILIACAASEAETNEDFGISVFFYPYPGAHDFRYFETSNWGLEPYNYKNFFQVDKTSEPVFNGYLRRFVLARDVFEKWIILSYQTENKIHVSDPILLKQFSKPTVINPDIIEIEQEEPGHPLFLWEEDNDEETVIYFQVVSDENGNLISGTYTYDKNWKFYDLSNVVLNIKEQNPPPQLIQGNFYTFTLMGVSEDNWVNLMGEKGFISQ